MQTSNENEKDRFGKRRIGNILNPSRSAQKGDFLDRAEFDKLKTSTEKLRKAVAELNDTPANVAIRKACIAAASAVENVIELYAVNQRLNLAMSKLGENIEDAAREVSKK